eukprot:3517713-Prymnesium_polylepis.1
MGPSTWAGLSGYCLIVIVILLMHRSHVRDATWRSECTLPLVPACGACDGTRVENSRPKSRSGRNL